MGTLVEGMADFATNLRFEELPAEVVHESKRILLDCIGCALAGLSFDKGKIAVGLAKQVGGAEEATIIGVGDKVSAFGAAFANGELINAMDYDNLTVPPGHVSPFVVPAPLALAERGRASGKSLICAIAAAHEVSTRFGYALDYYRDVVDGKLLGLSTGVGGSSARTIFGGTLASSMILGLSSQKMAQALGIAGSIVPVQPAKNPGAVPAPMCKYLMGGWIGETEVVAALLAEGGYRGDIAVLEGDHGFWRYIGSSKWNPEGLVERLGEEWRFPAGTAYKPYPCCRAMQTALGCFIHILDENQLQPEEIKEVMAYVDPHMAETAAFHNKEIETDLEAQMSVPYIFSVAAHRVRIGPEWQDLATLRDANILGFMDKVTCKGHPEFVKALAQDSASRLGKAEVIARGKTFSEERKYRKGSPATKETYMTDDELVAKFRHNASRVLPSDKISRAPEKILHLEDAADVSEVMRDVAI